MAPAPVAPPPPSAPPPPPPAPVQINHIVLVVLENHGFNTIFNNPAAPYLNSLATKYALAANYFGNSHGSLKDYFMLTTGVAASENGSFIGLYMDDNLVRVSAGDCGASGTVMHVMNHVAEDIRKIRQRARGEVSIELRERNQVIALRWVVDHVG